MLCCFRSMSAITLWRKVKKLPSTWTHPDMKADAFLSSVAFSAVFLFSLWTTSACGSLNSEFVFNPQCFTWTEIESFSFTSCMRFILKGSELLTLKPSLLLDRLLNQIYSQISSFMAGPSFFTVKTLFWWTNLWWRVGRRHCPSHSEVSLVFSM